MSVGMVLAAVALLVWPASVASERLRDLDDRRADGAADTSWLAAARRMLGRLPAPVVSPLVAGIVGLLVAGPLHACAAAVLAGAVVDLRTRAGTRRRGLTALGAWERALDDAASALRAGAGPPLALHHASDGAAAADPEVAGVLTAAASHARLGGDVATALRVGADRIAGELAGAWLLATRHGVVLADAVDSLRADVASRRERALRVDATLAGPRATAVILTALPGFGVLLGSGFGADPLNVLLTGTLGGALCLAGSVFLAAGLLWTDRIAGGAV